MITTYLNHQFKIEAETELDRRAITDFIRQCSNDSRLRITDQGGNANGGLYITIGWWPRCRKPVTLFTRIGAAVDKLLGRVIWRIERRK